MVTGSDPAARESVPVPSQFARGAPAPPARRLGILALQLVLVVATLAIALQAGLLPKLLRALAGWTNLAWPPRAAAAAPGNLESVLTGIYRLLSLHLPLLPWCLWLVSAAGLLLVAPRPRPRPRPDAAQRVQPRLTLGRLAVGAGLAAILAVALAARAANLLPDARGSWPASNFDEQVYYTAARLLAQGALPYRDFLLIHPPGMAYALAPGLLAQPPWGGPEAFGAARQWLLLFSLLAVPLIFLVGRRLGGPLCGLVAAAVLALDGIVAGVAVLETLVNVWSLLALLLYLYIPGRAPPRRRAVWIILCGACCAAALISKIPALAIVVALPLHALLLRRPAVAAGIAASTGAATLVALAPFLVVAPDALVREVVFFALLRPQEVKPGLDHALRIAAYPESYLTTTLAALGLLLLAAAIVRAGATSRRGARPPGRGLRRVPPAGLWRWLIVPLWATPVLAVFILSRTYHATHYVQWAPPLALLAGASVARPVWRTLLPGRAARRRTLAWAGIPLGMLLLLPLGGSAWQATFTVARDNVYLPAGALIRGLTAPDEPVLAFDPGYDFVAGRPPVRLPAGGRLVDSAAYMTYVALGLDRRPLGDLVSEALHPNKDRDALQVFQSALAQASILPGFRLAPVAVVDGKIGRPQLRGQTLGLLQALASSRQDVEHVAIYQLDPRAPAGYDFGALRLWALTIEPLAPNGTGTGATLLRGDAPPATVTIPAGRVLQIGGYWQPRPGLPDTRIHIRLATPAGGPLVDLDEAPGEGRETTHLWNPDFLYPDLHNIGIPPALAPGRYRLLLGVSSPHQPANLVPLPAAIVVPPRP